MPTLYSITEGSVRTLFGTAVWRRAKGLVGRVQEPVRVGDHMLRALFQAEPPYRVQLVVNNDGLIANCGCSYSADGYCEHVAALLLKWVWARGAFAAGTADSAAQLPLDTVPVEPPPAAAPDEPPPWLGPTGAGRQMRLDELQTLLRDYRLPALRNIARARDWPLTGTRKEQIVTQLLTLMTSPAEILKGILALDAAQQRVLRALLLLPNGLAGHDLLARVVAFGSDSPQTLDLDAVVESICRLGLAISPREVSSYWLKAAYVPAAIKSHLLPLTADLLPDARSRLPTGEAARLLLADPLPLLHSVGALLQLLADTAVPLRPPQPRPRMERLVPGLVGWNYVPEELAALSAIGGSVRAADSLTVPPPPHPLPDDAIARLAPVAGDARRQAFLYHLLQRVGLIWPGSPVTVAAEVREAFLQRDADEQRAILARGYFTLLAWSELWQMLANNSGLRLRRSLKLSLQPEELLAELLHVRHVVLHVLACLPDNQWIALSDLLPLLMTIWDAFDSSVTGFDYWTRDAYTWRLERDGQRLRAGQVEDWQAAQGAFLAHVVAGPLRWLGLVDLAMDGDRFVALRLHGLADLYWHLTVPPIVDHAAAAPRAAPPKAAVVIAGETITVQPTAVSPLAHALLDRIARLGQTSLHAFTYQLDVQAVYESFGRGETLDSLRQAWDAQLGVPMPDLIAGRLAAWWAAYGRAILYDGLTTIEFGDVYGLAEMKAVTSLAQHLVAEVSPRLVLIPDKAVDLLMAELAKAGYTPRLVQDGR